MAELEDHQKQSDQTEEADAKLQVMDAYTVFDQVFMKLAKAFPSMENFYCEQLKPTVEVYKKKWECISLEAIVDLIRKKYENIPFYYEMIEQQSAILNLVHGLFLMLYGGSWASLATFISFCSVYKVYPVLGDMMAKIKGTEMQPIKSCLYQLWLLIMVLYAVWTIPILSKITVAFMLEKYVSRTIINPIIKLFEEELPIAQMFGRWWPLVLKGATRMILAIMAIFFYNIQVCLVMACIGYHKLCIACSPALHEQIQAMEGPFKLDGTALALWASALACTAWQLWNSYESSYLGILVPLGFIIHANKAPDTYKSQ